MVDTNVIKPMLAIAVDKMHFSVAAIVHEVRSQFFATGSPDLLTIFNTASATSYTLALSAPTLRSDGRTSSSIP